MAEKFNNRPPYDELSSDIYVSQRNDLISSDLIPTYNEDYEVIHLEDRMEVEEDDDWDVQPPKVVKASIKLFKIPILTEMLELYFLSVSVTA